MDENEELRRFYDEKILFPFVGLVKEFGKNFGGETASLTQPSNLNIKIPKYSSA